MELSSWETRLQTFAGAFGWIQLALICAVLWTAWRVLGIGGKESGFKHREADRPRPRGPRTGPELGESRIRTPQKPQQLPGLSLAGEPHQILGVGEDASEPEIQNAYRELMKRFHPDRIGPAGSREWEDAQGIAAALSRARDELLAKRRRSR
ncbi:MAG: DnaJ domain-containing protein [Bdellovibrionales bacterium]|nr:DnaJ domain-containing protein [Bdellovibrionales bacterium]